MIALIHFEIRKLLAERKSLLGLVNIVIINVLFSLAFYLRNRSHADRPHHLDQSVLVGELVNAYMYTLGILAPCVFMLFPMVLSVMGAFILAGEIENGSIRMMLFRPVARWQLLVGKFVALSAYSMVMLLLLGVLSYLAALLQFDPSGKVLVPGPMFMLRNSHLLMPDQALPRIFLAYTLALPMLMSVSAMSLMLALVMRHFTSATILTSTVYFASYIIGSLPMLSGIHPYLPTRYWPFWKFALMEQIPWDTIVQYGCWTGVYTLVFLGLGCALFSMKDV